MEEESTSSDIGICGKFQLDTWNTRICKKFFIDRCEEGDNCKLKHTSYIKDVVCKFFLLHGKCFKGPQCPFLHEIVAEKLPECKNQTSNSKCSNPLCKFRHNTNKEVKECVDYNAGFCKMGKFCKFKHKSRELCRNYLEFGECKVESCENFHLKVDEENSIEALVFGEYLEDGYYRLQEESKEIEYGSLFLLCFRCMQFGHHPSKCVIPDKNRVVRCYKCMKYGHKSNSCTVNSGDYIIS